jgi:hypothetical protein
MQAVAVICQVGEPTGMREGAVKSRRARFGLTLSDGKYFLTI